MNRIHESIPDDEIKIPGYVSCRKDRNRNGGGLVLYIRECFSFILRSELIPNQLEMVCIEIRRQHGKSFLISAWYSHRIQIQIYLIALKRSLKSDQDYENLFILGDLNCDWNKSPLDSHTHRLKRLCTLYQLRQIINEPTRVTKSSATPIDLILLNNPESISNFGVIELGISDHSLIYVVKKLVPSKGQRKCIEIRNFKNFNERLFLADLSTIPWEYIKQFNNPNDCWQVWKSFFMEVLNRHAPISSM